MTSENIKKIPSSQPITQSNVANVLHEHVEGYLNVISAMSGDDQLLCASYEIGKPSADNRIPIQYIEVLFSEVHFREEVLIGLVQKWTHSFQCYPEDGYWKAEESDDIDETTVAFDELDDLDFHIRTNKRMVFGLALAGHGSPRRVACREPKIRPSA